MLNWLKKKSKPEAKSYSIPIPYDSFLAFSLGGSSYVTARQAMIFYRNNSSVATAVDMLADSFEQIKPVLKQEDGQFIEDHEVINLLMNPNGFDTWRTFAGKMSRHYLLKHDSHLTAAGSVKRPPIQLYSAKPQDISTMQAQDLHPLSYNLTQGDMPGVYVRLDNLKLGARFYDGNLKELYHIKGFSSRNNELEGDSPLQAAATEAKQQIEGRNHNLKLIQNGARLSLVISFNDPEPGVDDDTHKERVQSINETLSGSESAGKVGVFSNSEIDTIKEFGLTNKDMDYAKLDETAAQAIYKRYKIPLPLVTTEATTFNNMETAIELLYDLAVLPLADTLFAGCSMFLLPRYGLDPAKVQITYNPESINALKKRRLDEIEQRRKFNIETMNELRDMLPNRQPMDGGDTVYQPANLIPVGFDITDMGSEGQPEGPEEPEADVELESDE
jgi:HK97 family phage portal protein